MVMCLRLQFLQLLASSFVRRVRLPILAIKWGLMPLPWLQQSRRYGDVMAVHCIGTAVATHVQLFTACIMLV